jgi:hypothetical protein
MRKIIAGAAMAVSLSAFGVQFDPPDLALEHELHRQYLKQSGPGVGIAEFPALTKDSYIERYRIQKGETLWSLSQTFYGDGHYWPRVWAQNQTIDNPNLIRPGHTLQFLLGSEDDTPSFRISEEDEQGVELANSSSNSNPLIEIPPPEITPKPVLKVPDSFPAWQSVYKRSPVRITDDKGLLKQRAPVHGKNYLTAYVQEDPLVAGGWFMETDLDSALPTTNQYLYVKVNKGTARVGQKMLIVRDLGQLKTMNKQTEMPDANLIQITGEVELSELAQSDTIDEDFDVYRALMTRATSLSLRGSSLIVGELQEISTSYEGQPGTTNAQIIGNGRHEASGFYAPGDIVFLNKGSNDGLASGQILDVYVDRTIRKRETDVKFSPAPSGTVRIVRVTPLLATAVLLGARDGIQPGDVVRQVSSRAADREVMDTTESHLGKGADEIDIELDLDADEPDFGGPEAPSDDPDLDSEF